MSIASTSPPAFSCHLGEEAVALVDGVVEFREGVADLEASDVELEALDPVGLVGLDLGEGGDGEREVVDDGGLDEVGSQPQNSNSVGDCICRWVLPSC